MLTRTATYPDRETAQWATQEVITRNEQAIHRWLAQGTRLRITLEAAWPSRPEPVGRVLLQAMAFAGRGPVDVRAARVVLRREPGAPHGFVVHTTVPIYL
ncbi:RNase A-like domain-containing protein [Streptomyces virginiae]|uniref:RNase A-like domain-containing protein n=1 Tax=Streptomyces virginiae TaxID=1961 RepID=UPI002DBC5E99|nr:RNase A-like domain-containing protein [Streptomyces sp. CMAA1738]MEC4571076.1 RNase A-like domain-containing protein [Streptomyces sp. CMAA1738]